jgi:sigma-B regulation protein RsbU (phosphoserine phosphatase)
MKKLLLIEDENTESTRIIRVLSNYKFKVKNVSNGIQGLEALKEFQPDLLIIDLEGNEKIGLDVIAKTSKENPKTQILVISSALDNDIVDQSLECGADTFIHKPIDEAALIKFLDERSSQETV